MKWWEQLGKKDGGAGQWGQTRRGWRRQCSAPRGLHIKVAEDQTMWRRRLEGDEEDNHEENYECTGIT